LNHLQQLLDLAEWLEDDATHVAYFMLSDGFAHAKRIASIVIERPETVANLVAALEVRRRNIAANVLRAACLVRLVGERFIDYYCV
jgi:hypothetical protein